MAGLSYRNNDNERPTFVFRQIDKKGESASRQTNVAASAELFIANKLASIV